MKQQDLALGIARGAAGIEQAAEHAERVEVGWVEHAASMLAQYGRRASAAGGFLIEEARDWIAFVGWPQMPELPEPPDLRAWGAATQMAVRRGWITATGAFRRAASSNGSPKAVYRAAESKP